MRVTKAIIAILHGVYAPSRIREVTKDAAMAVFAIAVVVVSLTSTWAALNEQNDPILAAEAATLLPTPTQAKQAPKNVDLSAPKRQFTVALGGALQKTIIPSVSAALMFMIVGRFLTNQNIGYLQSLAAFSATALIEVLGIVISYLIHVAFHTIRFGLHAGVFVDPHTHPMWFVWLQNLDVFSLWQFIAAGVGIVVWNDLHWKYGIIVGGTVWFVSRLILGSFSLMAWFSALMGQ